MSWKSFKQPITAELTKEVNYIAVSNAAKEAIFLKKLSEILASSGKSQTLFHCCVIIIVQ